MRAAVIENAAGATASAPPRPLAAPTCLRIKQEPQNISERGPSHASPRLICSTCSNGKSRSAKSKRGHTLPPWDLVPHPRHILFNDLSPLSRRRFPLTILNRGKRPQPVRVLNRPNGGLHIGTGNHLSLNPVICPLLAPGLSLRVHVGAPPLLGTSVEQALRVVGPEGHEVEVPVEGSASLLSFTCPPLLQFSPVPPGVQQQQQLPITNTSSYSIKVAIEIAQADISSSIKALLDQKLLQVSFHPQQLLLEPLEVGCINVQLKTDCPTEVSLSLLLVCKRTPKAPSCPRCSIVPLNGLHPKRSLAGGRLREKELKQRASEGIQTKINGASPTQPETVQWSGLPPKVEAQVQLQAASVVPRWAFTVEGSELQCIDFGALYHGEERCLTVHANNLGAIPLAMSFLVPQNSLSCYPAGLGPRNLNSSPLMQLTHGGNPKELQEKALPFDTLTLPSSLQAPSDREAILTPRVGDSNTSRNTAYPATETPFKPPKAATPTQGCLGTGTIHRRSSCTVPVLRSCSSAQQQQQQLEVVQAFKQSERAANQPSSPIGLQKLEGIGPFALAPIDLNCSKSEECCWCESSSSASPKDTPWEALVEQFSSYHQQESPAEAPNGLPEEPPAPSASVDGPTLQSRGLSRRGRSSRMFRRGVDSSSDSKKTAGSSILHRGEHTASSRASPRQINMQPVTSPPTARPPPSQKQQRSTSSHFNSKAGPQPESTPATAAAVATAGAPAAVVADAPPALGASDASGTLAATEGAAAAVAAVTWKERSGALWGPLAALSEEVPLGLPPPPRRSTCSPLLPVSLQLRRLSDPFFVLGSPGTFSGPQDSGGLCAIEVTPSALLLPPRGTAAVRLKLRSPPCELQVGFQHLESWKNVKVPVSFHFHVLVTVPGLRNATCSHQPTTLAGPRNQAGKYPCSRNSNTSSNANSSSGGCGGSECGVPTMGLSSVPKRSGKTFSHEHSSPMTARTHALKTEGPQGRPVVARLRPETAGATAGLAGTRRRDTCYNGNLSKSDRGSTPCVLSSLHQLLLKAIPAETNAAKKKEERRQKACTRSPPQSLNPTTDPCYCCCCCPTNCCCCCCSTGKQAGAAYPVPGPAPGQATNSGSSSGTSSSGFCSGVSVAARMGCRTKEGPYQQLLSPYLHHQFFAGRFELRLPRLEVSPGALHFPGCVVGDEQQQVLLLLNCSSTRQLDFCIEARHPFQCKPARGLLPPQQQFKVYVTFTPKRLGPFAQTLKVAFCNKAYIRSIRLTGAGVSNPKPRTQESA